MTKVTPFRMIGNIYFVGTVEASSHLIDTGDGLILIDTGYAENAETVLESVNMLGYDIKDVKIILHSHGHYDHTAATAKLLSYAPNAKTYLSFHDIRYIEGFTPDFDICDGDVIALGNTKIECWFTPGHTEGSVSFFLDVEEDGQTYHAAMFGGSGVKQLKKAFMNGWEVPYLCRGLFFDSVERLLQRKVDVMLGNHTWQNHTLEKGEKCKEGGLNPFVDPTEWERYLTRLHAALWRAITDDQRLNFINYAHRGASEYSPENTMSAFRMGLEMGANGIETDIQKTKDGLLVLFHDDTLERVVGVQGSVKDYTYEELLRFDVKKGELTDKIPLLEEFLAEFAAKETAFALELKVDGIEKEVAELIYKYGVAKKTMVTSFSLPRLQKIKEYAPYLHTGYLAKQAGGELIETVMQAGVDEFCPNANIVTEELVTQLHRKGFNVRAWGVKNAESMRTVFKAGADGMTVNAPDILKEILQENTEKTE